MAKFDFDLCVLGGGAAGLTVASGATRLGMRTLLAEREPLLGGDCLHYGCVPSKTLIKTAKVRQLMNRAREFGLPEAALPPVDFRDVAARIRSVINTIQAHDSVERFCSLGVRVEFGPARFLDEHRVEIGEKRFSAGRIVIATGSAPAIPPIPGLDSVPFLTNLDVFSLDQLPRSLAVLGAGPIACELGQAFARLGSRVTLIQRGGQILSAEDADLAAVAEQALRAEGVDIRLGCAVREVRQSRSDVEVLYEQADGPESVHSDRGGHGIHSVRAERLLVALGRRSNVDGLGLENAGVAFTAGGIAVDARMRTSRKHIFAAGDVTGKHRFTHAAGYEGGIVVTNAAMRLPRRADYTFLPHCTYTDPELAGIGRNEKDCRREGIECVVHTEPFSANDRALAESETRGLVKLILDRRGRPLGVRIAGPHAGELAGEWVAVLRGKVGLSTLAGAVHPYPTLVEINKRIAGNVYAPRIFSERVRKILHFLFGHRGNACNMSE
ncbi:MAG: NAD(P)/FAD-dependent oxidoreductase [Desulfovibrio sp.]